MIEKMLLGKRPRPPMKRTTSLSDIKLDVNSSLITGTGSGGGEGEAADHTNNNMTMMTGNTQQRQQQQQQQQLDQRLLAAAAASSPRPQRRASADVLETAPFLRACSLCNRRLVGRDIYMYRGDSAFCSLECRQQQMSRDERKEKCSLAASKKEVSVSTATKTDVSATKPTETVSAI